MQTEKLRQRY